MPDSRPPSSPPPFPPAPGPSQHVRRHRRSPPFPVAAFHSPADPRHSAATMGFSSSSIPLFVRPKSLPFVNPSRSTSAASHPIRTRQSPFALLPFGNSPRRIPRSVETALLINAVPFLWGSYAAAAKIITNLEPTVPLTLLNLLTTFSSFLALYVVRDRSSNSTAPSPFTNRTNTSNTNSTTVAPNPHNPASNSNNNSSTTTASPATSTTTHQQTSTTTATGTPNNPSLSRKPVSLAISAELGGYLFFGAWLHLRSVAFTSASRSSFFIQFTTFFVPLIELLMGNAVSPAVIPACILTLAGAACLVLPEDPSAVNSFSSLFASLNYGDVLGIISAVSYSLHIVRVQVLAPRAGASLPLVDAQVRGQLFFSFLWEVIITASGDSSGPQYLLNLPSLSPDNLTTSLLCIAWIGVATNAVSTWAQISGQQRVGASRAAIFYATQPVWAVVLSVMIGLDTLSTFEIIGGLLIVSGSVLLAVADTGIKGEG